MDERFIYRFFRDKQTRVSDAQDSDAESVNSDDAMEALEMFGEKGDKDLDFASAVEAEAKSGLTFTKIKWRSEYHLQNRGRCSTSNNTRSIFNKTPYKVETIILFIPIISTKGFAKCDVIFVCVM